MRKLLSLLFIVLLFSFPCAAQSSEAESTTPEPYSEDEFPQFMKDLRRAEIITLGSLPFVTLTSTLVYSGWRWGQNGFSASYFPNPFAKSSDENGLSQKEQIGVLVTSLGISVGIGLTDLLVNVIRRHAAKRRAIRDAEENAPVIVTPIDQIAGAVRLELPEKYKIAKAHREVLSTDDDISEDAKISFVDISDSENGYGDASQNIIAANDSEPIALQNSTSVPQNALALFCANGD